MLDHGHAPRPRTQSPNAERLVRFRMGCRHSGAVVARGQADLHEGQPSKLGERVFHEALAQRSDHLCLRDTAVRKPEIPAHVAQVRLAAAIQVCGAHEVRVAAALREALAFPPPPKGQERQILTHTRPVHIVDGVWHAQTVFTDRTANSLPLYVVQQLAHARVHHFVRHQVRPATEQEECGAVAADDLGAAVPIPPGVQQAQAALEHPQSLVLQRPIACLRVQLPQLSRHGANACREQFGVVALTLR